MVSSSQQKRARQKYKIFFAAVGWSLLGLVFYLLGKHFIPFPSQWLFLRNTSTNDPRKFFLFGISVHSSVSFFLGLIFMLFNSAKKKSDPRQMRRWKYWINKSLVFLVMAVWTLGIYQQQLFSRARWNWENIILVTLTTIVINCCLIDFLIQLMNQYGICNAFNLLFFVDYLPTHWIKEKKWNWARGGELLGCLFVTALFIYLTNYKWEVPVETNTLYSQDNKLAKKNISPFGLKLNLSFMPFYYLSSILSFFYNAKIMIEKGDGWLEKIIGSFLDNPKVLANKAKSLAEASHKSNWEFFLALSEEKKIFRFGNFVDFSGKFLGALLILIILRFLFNWLLVGQTHWNAQEISQDFRRLGIYFDGIPPGRPTKIFLRKIINQLVIYWFVMILFFNLVFDNLMTNSSLSFISWFSSVNVGTSLIQQIITKYKYIQVNK